MYGDIASKLVQEARRAQNLDSLPAYASDLVQNIVREINELDRDSSELMGEYEKFMQDRDEYEERMQDYGGLDELGNDIEITNENRNRQDDGSESATNSNGRPAALSPDKERQLTCALVVLRLCTMRNKRCLLAYQRLRADAIDRLTWDETDPQDPNITYNLAPGEQDYFSKYTELVIAHKGKLSEIDLTGPLEPPKDLFVDVRVLKDAGEIQTEYG